MAWNSDPKATPTAIDSSPVTTGASHDRVAAMSAEAAQHIFLVRKGVDEIINSINYPENSGQPATLISAKAEPYAITDASNDAFVIEVDDDGTDHTIDITAGAARTAQEVVDDLNGTLVGATADVYQPGDGLLYVRIRSDVSTVASQLEVKTVANDAYATLGFVVGVRRGDKNEFNDAKAALDTALDTAAAQTKRLVDVSADLN